MRESVPTCLDHFPYGSHYKRRSRPLLDSTDGRWTHLNPDGNAGLGINNHLIISSVKAGVHLLQSVFKGITTLPIHAEPYELLQLGWREMIVPSSMVFALRDTSSATAATDARPQGLGSVSIAELCHNI